MRETENHMVISHIRYHCFLTGLFSGIWIHHHSRFMPVESTVMGLWAWAFALTICILLRPVAMGKTLFVNHFTDLKKTFSRYLRRWAIHEDEKAVEEIECDEPTASALSPGGSRLVVGYVWASVKNTLKMVPWATHNENLRRRLNPLGRRLPSWILAR